MFRTTRWDPLAGCSLLAGPVLVLLGVSLLVAAPAPVPRKPTMEIVFCLDCTGSMAGLIDGAKLKIWSMCNQVLNGRPMPNLKVGLVGFRDKGDDYVTKVFDLRDDLDEVYSDLQTFSANGGGDTPEHVNQAIDDAVNKISWSQDRKAIKIIFLVGDAPPHMDYNDDVKYPTTCARAMERGILINCIQCGNDADCTRFWKDICEKGGGNYVAIPQAGGVRGISTPYDKRLVEINAELTRSIIVFGDSRKRESDARKAQTVLTLPPEVAADRAGYLAKEGKAARYDLLDTIRAGKIRLESLRNEELPPELQKMSARERQDHLNKVGEMRTRLLREAHDLDRQRSANVSKELEKNKDSFDGQVLDMLRKQSHRRVRY
ncbi:MAG: VWA domain-containing protein [Gemmataceae bacterium]